MTDIPGKSAADIENSEESKALIAKQQADFAESQKHTGGAPKPLDDDGVRAAGGYLLNDPQWVVSEGFGKDASEANTPENRREIIKSMVEAGTAIPFERNGEIAGYFPAKHGSNVGSFGNAVRIGNDILAGLVDASQYVPEA